MGDQIVARSVSPTRQNLLKPLTLGVSQSIKKSSINSTYASHTILWNSPVVTEKYLENLLRNVSQERRRLSEYSDSRNNSAHTSQETFVMNENITNKLLNMSDNQVNANFLTDFNTTDGNMTYAENVTRYESGLHNSEQVSDSENDGLTENMSAIEIIGICLCCVFLVAIFCSIGYFFYNNRGFNRPEVLNDHCSNPDSSGYLDDTSVRDNSEEMYSLDNDSFLNSLEAMTIQNYWTDTVKHTKL